MSPDLYFERNFLAKVICDGQYRCIWLGSLKSPLDFHCLYAVGEYLYHFYPKGNEVISERGNGC